VVIDFDEAYRRYLHTATATRTIFVFALTSASAESPSRLCDWNDCNAVSHYRLAKDSRSFRDGAQFLSDRANESICRTRFFKVHDSFNIK
jgi:hypothetical protein